MAIKKLLAHVSPDDIIKNPENPRVIFREEELDALMRSIEQVGIQVPLSVYEKGNKFVLIDGERRWRSSIKLGLKQVPVIVEPKPTPLENLLMMFNIHNVRVQWDLLALAFKIDKVRELVFQERSVELTKTELDDLTGVTTSYIARCDELLALPKKYQELIWKELEKPKGEQKYTEDLFLEIKKSVKTIENYLPEIAEKHTSKAMLDTFFTKYQSGVETNRVKFRDLSKIARGELVGISKEKILKAVKNYITKPKYTIEEAFQDSVGDAYTDRTIERKLSDVDQILKDLTDLSRDDHLRPVLKSIRKEVDRLLK